MDFSKNQNMQRDPFNDETYLLNITENSNNHFSPVKRNFIEQTYNKVLDNNETTTDVKNESYLSNKKTINVKDKNNLRNFIDASFVN